MNTSITILVMILLAYTIIHNSNNNHKETLRAVELIRTEVKKIRSDVDKELLKHMSEEQLNRAKKALNDKTPTTNTNQKSN